MDLLVDKVDQLQDVDEPDRDVGIEWLTGPAVVEGRFAIFLDELVPISVRQGL